MNKLIRHKLEWYGGTTLAMLLLASVGCGETPDPLDPPDHREERISLIERFEPRSGSSYRPMFQDEVEDALGVPDFIEEVDIKGEDSDYVPREDEALHLGYGPFGAQTSDGTHVTKYRLNLIFVRLSPSGNGWRGFNLARERGDQETMDRWHSTWSKPAFVRPWVKRWYRESP